MLFEAIVANPPFSAKWSAKEILKNDDRYAPYGKLAPASKADYAFVTHMLHHLDENGAMAIVLPHGPLFRGGTEGTIREFIIREKNWLDAVIGLPENIFYGTGIPTCIMVFKKCREVDDVLFVDASDCFAKGKNQNVLAPAHIDRIFDAFSQRTEEDRFSRRVPRQEIANNGYNLNIPRYVDTYVAQPEIDLTAVARDLRRIETEMAAVDGDIRRFCADLGLESPV